jgi:predicted nucleic-acid-binding protein
MSKALQDYRNGFDFADMLIGYWGKGRGYNKIYTFDKKTVKPRLHITIKVRKDC